MVAVADQKAFDPVFGDVAGGEVLPWEHVPAGREECLLGVRGVLLHELEEVRVALVDDRPSSPRESVVVDPDAAKNFLLVGQLPEGEVGDVDGRRAVLGVEVPREEQRGELGLAFLGGEPLVVEVVTPTVRGGLEHDRGAGGVRDRLTESEHHDPRIRVERHLGRVEEVGGGRPAGALVARGGDLHVGLSLHPPDVVLRVRLRGVEPTERVVVPVPVGHLQQVL